MFASASFELANLALQALSAPDTATATGVHKTWPTNGTALRACRRTHFISEAADSTVVAPSGPAAALVPALGTVQARGLARLRLVRARLTVGAVVHAGELRKVAALAVEAQVGVTSMRLELARDTRLAPAI